jgi:uncharacterized repeat protein (TIGR01451 family)
MFGSKKDTNDPLEAIEVPGSWFGIGFLVLTIGAMAVAYFGFGIPPLLALIAVPMSFILCIVACRATGETDTTPIGALGKITQLTYGVLIPQNMNANLMTASITGNTAGTDPDLGVPAAKIGDMLHYTLTYHGAGPLTNAVITDVLPQGLQYTVGSAAGDAHFTFISYTPATRTLRWESATLLDPLEDDTNTVDGAVTYSVKVLASAPGFAQPLVNVATIDSDQTPPDSATAKVAVLAPPQELTPPPTSTLTPQDATSNPGFALMLILLGVAGLSLGIGFVTPAPARARRRDRRG